MALAGTKRTTEGEGAGTRFCVACRHGLGGQVAYCPFCGVEQVVAPPPPPRPIAQPRPVAQPRPPVAATADTVVQPQPAPSPWATAMPATGGRRPGRRRIGWLVLGGLLLLWLVSRPSVAPGTLTVILTRPVAGSILVDDTPSGRPGEAIRLAPGEHRIGLQARGWTANQRTVILPSGGSLRILLQPRPMPVAVTVSTEPAASFLVDGRLAGSTPATLSLLPGIHTLHVTANGYMPTTRTISLRPGETESLRLTLRAMPPRMISLFAAVGRWSRPVDLPSGARFRLAFQGRLRLRLGGRVFLIESDQAANLGAVDPGSLQVKSAQAFPFPVSLFIEQGMRGVASAVVPVAPGGAAVITRDPESSLPSKRFAP